MRPLNPSVETDRLLGLRRLEILADHILSLPRAKTRNFDMRVVAEAPSIKAMREGACGTAACMLGWGPMIPKLRRAGLHYVSLGEGELAVIFMREDNWGAAMDFYALTIDEVAFLFDYRPGGPKTIAKQFKRFIAGARRETNRGNKS